MKTIGCSGGSKLTRKDLEKIVGNMQAGAVVVHDTPDLAKSKPFASSGTYAVGKAKENQSLSVLWREALKDNCARGDWT